MVSAVRHIDRADNRFASPGDGLAPMVAVLCSCIDCVGGCECDSKAVEA